MTLPTFLLYVATIGFDASLTAAMRSCCPAECVMPSPSAIASSFLASSLIPAVWIVTKAFAIDLPVDSPPKSLGVGLLCWNILRRFSD